MALSQRIGATTGGISASITNSTIRGQPSNPQAHLMLRGKAMAAQATELSTLLGDILMQTDW